MSDFPVPPPPPPDHLLPPPGYVPYGGFGAAQGSFGRIRTLTTWLVALLGVSLVVQVASVVVQLALRGAARDFVDRNITAATFDDRLGVYLLVVVLAAVIAMAQVVILIVWTFRMAKNLQVLRREPQSFKPGVTIIVNIFGTCTLGILNYFMWRELWIGSDPETAPGDPTWKRRPAGSIILVHLVLTLLSIVVGFGISVGGSLSGLGTNDNEEVAKNLTDKLGVVVASGLLQVAVSAVFIVLVRQLAARHMSATREE